MSFNTIKHPTTKEEFSIFSSQGRNILKNYLKVYKSGGENNTNMIGGKCVKGTELRDRCRSGLGEKLNLLNSKISLSQSLGTADQEGKTYSFGTGQDIKLKFNVDLKSENETFPAKTQLTIGDYKKVIDYDIRKLREELKRTPKSKIKESKECNGVIDVKSESKTGEIEKIYIDDNEDIKNNVYCNSHTPYLNCYEGKDCDETERQCYNTEEQCKIGRLAEKGYLRKTIPPEWTTYNPPSHFERTAADAVPKTYQIYKGIKTTYPLLTKFMGK